MKIINDTISACEKMEYISSKNNKMELRKACQQFESIFKLYVKIHEGYCA